MITIVLATLVMNWVAAIAPWFHLHLPSCGPGFESQAHHLRFFQKNQNKQKEAGIGPLKKQLFLSCNELQRMKLLFR